MLEGWKVTAAMSMVKPLLAMFNVDVVKVEQFANELLHNGAPEKIIAFCNALPLVLENQRTIIDQQRMILEHLGVPSNDKPFEHAPRLIEAVEEQSLRETG